MFNHSGSFKSVFLMTAFNPFANSVHSHIDPCLSFLYLVPTSPFGVSGGSCFVIVVFLGYLHFYIFANNKPCHPDIRCSSF